MTFKDALQILELSTPFTNAELKKAYAQALKVWHPDRFTVGDELHDRAHEKTRLIIEAYGFLTGALGANDSFPTAPQTTRQPPLRADDAPAPSPTTKDEAVTRRGTMPTRHPPISRDKSLSPSLRRSLVIVGAAALVGWGGYQWWKSSSNSAENAKAVQLATKESPFENSLGMKFVPVAGTRVLFCIHPTRKGDYRRYAEATSRVDDSWNDVKMGKLPVSYAEDHPVVNVSWEDANDFCAWLSKKEKQMYRLPTDHEWSVAVGTGGQENPNESPEELAKLAHQSYLTTGQRRFVWGAQWPPPAGAGNFADETAHVMGGMSNYIPDYDDGYATTSPVMHFTANPFGLFDMAGNVWQWCDDNYDDRLTSGNGVMRGGSWGGTADSFDPSGLHSSHRSPCPQTFRLQTIGFRCVLVLAAQGPPPTFAALAERDTGTPTRQVDTDNPAPRIAANDLLQHLPSDQRLSSRSVLSDRLQGRSGRGKLTLDNGLSEDACVKLVSNGALAASFYVRGGEKFTFEHIPDNSYQVLYCIGYGWNAATRDFARGRHARRYDSPLAYATRTQAGGGGITTYTDEMTLTLHKVPHGNATTSDISLDEFDRY